MIDYIRDMNKNYIKICCEESRIQESYCMKMVEKNNIDGVIKPRVVDLNGKVNWLYEISGMISLEERYADKLFSAADISYISEFLKGVIINGRKYMLDLDGFILSPKYIVCGVGRGEWHLIYNITEKNCIRNSLKQLLEFILERLDHKDGQAVVVGYALYKRVCQEELYIEQLFEDTENSQPAENSPVGVELIVNEKEYNSVVPEVVQEEKEIKLDMLKAMLWGTGGLVCLVGLLAGGWGITSGIIEGHSIGSILMDVFIALIFIGIAAVCIWLALGRCEYFNMIVSEVKKIKYTVNKLEIKQSDTLTSSVDLCEERSGNSTMLLSGMACTKLIMRGKGSRGDREFILEDMPVTIGSAKADIVIDEPGISRIHARISREGELLFIKDMNSTNGTWVNDHQLTVYELCKINNGDIIKLADTSFELIDTLF